MIKVRNGVWETNSSSVHSLIMCNDDDFQKLFRGEYMIAGYGYKKGKYNDKFVSTQEVYDYFKENFNNNKSRYEYEYGISSLDDENLDIDMILANDDIAYTLETYGGEEYEKFDDYFITDGGEKIWAFGYFGRDG